MTMEPNSPAAPATRVRSQWERMTESMGTEPDSEDTAESSSAATSSSSTPGTDASPDTTAARAAAFGAPTARQRFRVVRWDTGGVAEPPTSQATSTGDPHAEDAPPARAGKATAGVPLTARQRFRAVPWETGAVPEEEDPAEHAEQMRKQAEERAKDLCVDNFFKNVSW